MTIPNLLSDGYERKARLYPALVLLLPVLACVVAITAASLSSLQSVAITLGGCGGAFFLAQLARDAGKHGEQALFARWGGMPSVAILRHRDNRVDAITKARYHQKLSALVKGTKTPTAAAEAAGAAGSDQMYAAWSTYLRVHTRDTKKYSLLFQENVNYGYRRNLWGLRRLGILTSALSTVTAVTVAYVRSQRTGALSEAVAGAAAISVVFLVLWTFRFTATWVRIPAEAYAERLMETIDNMGSKAQATKKA